MFTILNYSVNPSCHVWQHIYVLSTRTLPPLEWDIMLDAIIFALHSWLKFICSHCFILLKYLKIIKCRSFWSIVKMVWHCSYSHGVCTEFRNNILYNRGKYLGSELISSHCMKLPTTTKFSQHSAHVTRSISPANSKCCQNSFGCHLGEYFCYYFWTQLK